MKPGTKRLTDAGLIQYAAGEYSVAHRVFIDAAEMARKSGDLSGESFSWNQAGNCSIRTAQFASAMAELRRARKIAEGARAYPELLASLNSLATLYIQLGQYAAAIDIATVALTGPAANDNASAAAKLKSELGRAQAHTGRFDEALLNYLAGVNGLLENGDIATAARVFGNLGNDSVTANRPEVAEWALGEGLRIVRVHRIDAAPNILDGLGRLRALQGRTAEASMFFAGALAAPPGPTPRWYIYEERGRFRLSAGDAEGALADYREARSIITRMRLDMVPADQDRVTFENGLSDVLVGLLDAGNIVARGSGDQALLKETFDAAEQDRLWSLRTLVPSTNDWRTRLPARYWELLAQYQAAARHASSQASDPNARRMADLRAELQRIEIDAGSASPVAGGAVESPLDHARSALGKDSVLFSFHLAGTRSWVWAVDRTGVDVFPLTAAPDRIRDEAEAFTRAVKAGTAASDLGARIYSDLFGPIPQRYVQHPDWRIEPDGSLYNLPFAALITGTAESRPVYLVERASVETVPGALLLKQERIAGDSDFLGVGDPVYNAADNRYRGARGIAGFTLPRVPNTASELAACARAWSGRATQLLTGTAAASEAVESAVSRAGGIVHFATHVVAGRGDYQSGMIALSIDSTGGVGLLGPREIVARPTRAKLIVMNGCHSAQGQALPNSGLMGLTRAWIGAGASSVLSTQWDVQDAESQTLVRDFYRYLRGAPEWGLSAALRQAQMAAIRSGRPASEWAAYTLLSRIG